ncbi:MAG: hypothetical protein EOP52_03180 [Sphingobacteriales bacterium]|nr:MAG: hypothetical protein EOP52_03180 [Sphingobacteriales bacterium]
MTFPVPTSFRIVLRLFLCLLSTGGLGCRPGPPYTYLANHKKIIQNPVLVHTPTVYEYVLVEHPASAEAQRSKELVAYADSLLQQNSDTNGFNYEVHFYRLTAYTAPYQYGIKDPNALANIYLQDQLQDYLGTYTVAICKQNNTYKLKKLLLIDSANESRILGQHERILSDGCTPK